MRNQTSKKNPYYLSKDRYLELQHFCRQYPEWNKRISEIGMIKSKPVSMRYDANQPKPVEIVTELRHQYLVKINMVETAVMEASDTYWSYILQSVTEGKSYASLTMNYGLDCPRDKYYILLRKFYWILDKLRK